MKLDLYEGNLPILFPIFSAKEKQSVYLVYAFTSQTPIAVCNELTLSGAGSSCDAYRFFFFWINSQSSESNVCVSEAGKQKKNLSPNFYASCIKWESTVFLFSKSNKETMARSKNNYRKTKKNVWSILVAKITGSMLFYVMFINCTYISALLETHEHPKQFKRIKSNIDIPWIQRTLYFGNNPAVFLKDQWLYSRRLLTEGVVCRFFCLVIQSTYGQYYIWRW